MEIYVKIYFIYEFSLFFLVYNHYWITYIDFTPVSQFQTHLLLSSQIMSHIQY